MYINLHSSPPLQHYVVEINLVTWPGIVINGLVTHEPFEDDQGVACHLYRNVRVVSQPDVVYKVECCGSEGGNCCVNADEAQGQRRLKSLVPGENNNVFEQENSIVTTVAKDQGIV